MIVSKNNLLLRFSRKLPSINVRYNSSGDNASESTKKVDPKSYLYPNTSVGIKERTIEARNGPVQPLQTPYPPFKDGKNPKTGESGGPAGPEPTRFGDWERKGRVTDF